MTVGKTALVSMAILMASASMGTEASLEFFEREVRPVLAEHCYSCHGPEKQKAGLRVDHLSFLLSGGESGPAITPGDAAASRIAEAMAYTNVDLQMPPKGKLSDEQIKVVQTWIEEGAHWPDEPVPTEGADAAETFDLKKRRDEHWAWQPINSPAPPAVANAAWPRHDIDHFILARLEAAGYEPAPEADRATLIRRLSFALTGLPPTPEAVARFAADESADAYERLVDELLASPDFGERWGRHWLDVTRYAETYGHEQDYPVEHAWRYRDYVIRAFNSDLPYDQLLREHIAGDLLPQPRFNVETSTNESLAATGFWYMHQATHAPVDVRQDQNDRIDNQIDVFSKAFLGMTVSCARCHDHKFDAISMADFYALAGFLKSSRQQHAYIDPQGKIAEGVTRLQRAKERVEAAIRAGFEQADAAAAPVYSHLMASAEAAQSGEEASEVAARRGLDSTTLTRWVEAIDDESTEDGAHPLHLWNKARQQTTLDAAWFAGIAAWASEAKKPPVSAGEVVYETFGIRDSFGAWTTTGEAFGSSPSGPGAWMNEGGRVDFVPSGVAHSGLLDTRLEGTLRSPDFIIEHDTLQYRAAGTGGQIRLIIEGYELREFNGLLFEQTFLDVKHGGEYRWLQQVDGIAKFKGRTAFIEIVDTGDGWIAVDEIRFSDTPAQSTADLSMARALLAPKLPSSLAELAARYTAYTSQAMLDWLAGTADASQIDWLGFVNRRQLAPLPGETRQFARAIAHKLKTAEKLPRPERMLAIAEGTPTDEILMLRGNYKTPGKPVRRRFLEALGDAAVAVPATGSGRRELAEALLAEDNPLTARVMVNRVWHYLMGRGLVPTVDNFGVLGQTPSHPELLDYLATRFRANGWSVKSLIRDIVTTQTYRMSSMPHDAAAEAADPDNVLLHRMNRRRLEAESIRDAILKVAGTLDTTRFGPSVPAYISPFVEGNRRPEVSGPADGGRRRSIYMEVRRNYMSPMLQAFDMPVPDTTQGVRNVSNVPAQALILMNDPFVLDQARAWSERIMVAHASIEDRVRTLYLEGLGREPSAEEQVKMFEFMDEQAKLYGLDAAAARDDARIWADLCHVMFTLKEFIFIA